MGGHVIGRGAAPGADFGRAVLGHPGLHLVQERVAIGLQRDAGQTVQRIPLGCRQLVQPQQVQVGHHRAGMGGQVGIVVFAQQGQFALQGHVVRVRFAAEHDQVAGHTAMRPFAQRLGHRTQQAQALGRARHHQHDGPVSRDAQLPQHAPVAHAVGCLGLRQQARRHRRDLGQRKHQRRGQGLQRGQVVTVRAVRRPLDACQHGRHDRRPLHIAGLAVFVDDGQ